MASKDIIQHQYKPGTSGNPNGRPKKILTKYSDMGYSKSEVQTTCAALAGMTKSELEVAIKDKEATVLEASIGKAFLKAMDKGEYKFIKDIIELFMPVGPKTAVQVNQNITQNHDDLGEFDLSRLSDEQVKQLNHLLSIAADNVDKPLQV